MSPEGWFTLIVIGVVMLAMASNRISVDVAMLGGLTTLLLGDVFLGDLLPLQQGLAGFAHPAMFTIGSLFIVAAGLSETGGIAVAAQHILGRPRSVAGAQLRLMLPVACMSGFMNNTPIVALYLPIVSDWARKLRISPSKLYMPLSFAALLGGKITLIGTASNIVVMGLFMNFVTDRLARESAQTAPTWLSSLGIEPLSSTQQFWAVGSLGLPTTLAGIALIVATSRWLLPERRPAVESALDSRRYQAEMAVQADSPIVGRSIEEAGLRHLPGLYLTQIERGDTVLHAVAPEEIIEANDVLAFAGILESVIDLRKIRGLVPATDQVEKIMADRGDRALVEAVVSHGSSLIGKSIRASQFRTRFNAAIIAVHRNGEMLEMKIGDIVVRPGDTLLLDTHAGFVDAHRNSDEFYLVSTVEGARPIRHDRASIALAILALLVALLVLTEIPPVVSALSCAGLMVLTRCVTGTVARNSINWQVLIVIGSALGIGEALKQTGAAEVIAHAVINSFSGIEARGMLLIVFTVAVLFAQVITSYGAAVLMFPIAMATAESLQASPEPFAMALMIAAGSTYLSPVAYQTNLMVYGPGGYRFLDYTRLGLPLTVIVAFTAIVLAPIFFPFHPV